MAVSARGLEELLLGFIAGLGFASGLGWVFRERIAAALGRHSGRHR